MHDGQPSRREAWYDDTVNARCGNFFRNTAETVQTPMCGRGTPGYIAFQTEASELLRRGLVRKRTAHRDHSRAPAGGLHTQPAGWR